MTRTQTNREPADDADLTPRDAAALLSVDPRTLQRWERQGVIRARRTIGGHRRYSRSDVDRVLAEAQAARS